MWRSSQEHVNGKVFIQMYLLVSNLLLIVKFTSSSPQHNIKAIFTYVMFTYEQLFNKELLLLCEH